MQTLILPREIVNGGLVRPAPLATRFDAQLLAPHIADAERAWLVPVIGEPYYSYLIAEKAGTESNYNAALGPIVPAFPNNAALEKLWTEHLLQFCAFAVVQMAAPFIVQQLHTAGLFLNLTEGANNAGKKSDQYIQEVLARRLEGKRAQIAAYVIAFADGLLYPVVADDCGAPKEWYKYNSGLVFYRKN